MEENNKHYLIVGLGNPEAKYVNTRHNMGFMVLEALAAYFGATFKEEGRFLGRVAKFKSQDLTVHLLMPTTYVNNSGMAVRKMVDFFQITQEKMLVVCDDVAFEFGDVRLKPQGGSGGHNGLKSIETHTGTQNYPRLRIGVGDREYGSLADHVLGNFRAAEAEQMPEIIERATNTARRWLHEDITNLMNDVNVRPEKDKKESNEEKQNIVGEDNNGNTQE